MGFLDRFRKKREEPLPLPEIPAPDMAERTSAENVKAKMDLVMMQLDSLNVKFETITARLDRIEKTMDEIYVIAKRTA